MFGDSTFEEDIADRLLEDFSLEEILEMNDLEPRDVLAILIRKGFVSEPRTYFNESLE